MGDKLTAFAPHTTGIPFGVDKEMEIMKQMYDIYTLIDVIDDFIEVKETYKRFVQAEIAYRGQEITYEEVLKDTIRANACIISKGHSDKDEFPLYMYRANSLKSHIFSEKYSGELATIQACKVQCLAAYVLVNAEQMIKINQPENYIDAKISMKENNKMAYMKKLKLEAYAYLVESVKLMDIDPIDI